MTEEVVAEEATETEKIESASPVAAKKERLGYIDVLRGIAMALVILGHCAPPYVDTFIFTFHVPLFFFISGMLFAFKEKQAPFFSFLKKKAIRLLVPYFCFEILNLLISFALSFVYSGVSVKFPDAILSIFTGFTSQRASYSGVAGQLWFFPCMFFAETAFYFIYAAVGFILKKLKDKKFYQLARSAAFLAVAAALYVCSYIESKYTPQWWLYTDVAIMAAAFLSFGCALSYPAKKFAESKLYVKIPVLVLSCAGWILFSYLNYFVLSNYVDVFMTANVYGDYKSFVFAAACGIIFVVSISSLIFKSRSRPVKFLTWLGKNSLSVFPVHLYPLFLIKTVICSRFNPYLGAWWLYASPWIEFICVTALAAPLAMLVQKYAPFMLGQGYKKEEKTNNDKTRNNGSDSGV